MGFQEIEFWRVYFIEVFLLIKKKSLLVKNFLLQFVINFFIFFYIFFFVCPVMFSPVYYGGRGMRMLIVSLWMRDENVDGSTMDGG